MFISRTLFWATLVQVAWATLAAGSILLALVWLLQSLRFLDFLVNKGLGLTIFTQLTGLMVPQLLTIILPIAVLAGAILVTRRMQDDHETTAVLAAGASPAVLALPLLALAGAAVVGGYILLLWLLPASTTAFKDLQREVRTRQGQLLLEEGTFNALGDNLMVYVRKRESPTSFSQLLVHDTREPTSPVTWYARFGELRTATLGAPQLVLQQGLRQESSKTKVSMLEFASYNLDLSTQLGVQQLQARTPEVEEGGLRQVWQEAHAPTTPANRAAELKAEVAKRLTWPLLPIPLVLLAAAALLHPPKRKQSSLRGAVLAGALGVACIAGQFGWLVLAQGGQVAGYIGLFAWPLVMACVAYGVWRYGR